jgi:DNA-binding TFAR19-related protein (PDSD5 family)
MKRKNRIKPDNLVANNPEHDRNSIAPAEKRQETLAKRDTLYDALNPFQKKILEIYGSKYGYRQTASGRWKERDEPDEDTQLKQADTIRKTLQAKMTAQSRERLKRANKVPTRKDGRKVFEEFCEQAYKGRRQEKTIDDADLKNIFNAAQHFSYEKWIWFVNDEYSSHI